MPLAVMLALAGPAGARAQDFSVNALGDLRLVVPSDQRSWMEGGLGKLRFDGGGDSHPELRVGQVLADTRLRFGSDLLAFATLRYAPDQKTAVDILEGYARYQPIATGTWLWSNKLGAFFPPISLENEGIGWTSPWSLTPSAINSWVGDELRTIGGETMVERRYETGAIGLIGAVFARNDPAGALLADHGWTFDDRPTGLLDHVRIPDDIALEARRRPPAWMSEFLEIDNQPGWYAGVDWRQNDLGRARYLHYDNRADPAARAFGQFAWRTAFDSFGLEADLGDYVLLSQAMLGETEINPGFGFGSTTHFQSAYALLGRHFGDWTVAARVDWFATQEHPGPNNDYSEHGNGLMLSASWGPVRWFRLGAELLRIDYSRVQRSEVGLPQHAVETQFQLNARFIY
jgi:hypothetical protein